jgi:hypothetical protein
MDWYYMGSGGKTGPLHQADIENEIRSGVIQAQTLVWREGLSRWMPAANTIEFGSLFAAGIPTHSPPSGTPLPFGMQAPIQADSVVQQQVFEHKSRRTVGLMQIFAPGFGRIYTGYIEIGIIQVVLTFITCFVAYPWALIDGILFLTGKIDREADGKPLKD